MSAQPAYRLDEATLAAFREILPADAIVVDEAGRDAYRDPYWHQEDRSYDSSAVLYPATTEEVQAVMRVADAHGAPIWVSSQGRNNGYGGPSPRVRGSVLVSLRRMNRVIEINPTLAYAVVEPGVTWFDLHEALQAGGHDDLMVSVPDLGWGSVIGNTMDSGVTYLPLGMDYQAPTGLEVVLADGSLLRTGMGAIPDSPSWHVYKRGLGPVLDPLFVQSNFGVVTRMGYWLMRRPAVYAPLFLTVPRAEQLEQAIDILRELRLDGVIRGVPVMQNTMTLSSHFPELLGKMQAQNATFSEAQLQQLADESGVGRWGMRTAVWGDERIVARQIEQIREAWAAIDGARVDHHRSYRRDEWDQIEHFVDKVQAGIPSLDMMESLPEGIGHVGFSPVVPLEGARIREVAELLERIVVEEAGSNFVAGICVISERSAMIVSGLVFDTTDAEQTTQAYATAKSMVRAAGERGYGEYRAHLDFMDLAAEQYSYGDFAYRRFVEKIKDAVDPNGILMPGRHGIWPSNRRPEDRAQ
ncbi:FAD-binding oxidoreductase [Leucobacter allii]|uniref:FAD-binding oxidoreductase n=1 Tax=Leucobacter allii TaxID=2932247 RepID=A0ABY4FKU1_9MICO|nr:FAD-binding oxidoreductase [Leucobacter allii]UOQ56885.1 FAD-binding oxidoreductase [Leucobacter allii]